MAHVPPPGFITPALPSLVAVPPAGAGWIHEIKHDGYRTQLVIAGGRTRAFTRNGHDWTDKYAPVVAVAERLGCRSAVIDGELVVQDERGVSDFAALRRAIHRQSERLVFFAFDLLQLEGEDLRPQPLEERRARLRALLAGSGGSLAFSDEFIGEGGELFRAAEKAGLEGIVSKRAGSRYPRGRATSWLKTKTFTTGTYEIIGLEKTPRGAPVALLAASGETGQRYVGNAFITLPAAPRELLWRHAEHNAAAASPIRGMRRRGTIWLKPGLQADVRHLRGEDMLRHATLQELKLRA
jgi:bifunctional non-homologous end joining protein LigD